MRGAMMWLNPFLDTGKILVEQPVLETIDRYVQDVSGKPESGGILLGFRRGGHLHIVNATVPQSDDRRSMFSFVRQDRRHQLEAMRLWQASGERADYLGEWHTHPEIDPTPSGHDVSEWRKISSLRELPMVFLIAGMRSALWTGVGIAGAICKCQAAGISDSAS